MVTTNEMKNAVHKNCKIFYKSGLIKEVYVEEFQFERDEDEEPVPYIQVACSYEHIRPNVVLVAGGKKTALDEESIGSLDYAEIKAVDLVIRPYIWSVGDKEGIKAYVKTMYAVIEEDKLGSKYDQINDDDYPF